MRAFQAFRTLLLASLVSIVPASSFAGVFLSITIAPPMLPVYAQPVCPGDGYLWTPGYWAYAEDGYFWVPGTWVLAPRPGFLWTPGYWGWGNGAYLWHTGYWGPHVGFYGGVNYGYGYGGEGFYGGRWEGEHFRYNAAVLHVDNRVVHNTYIDRTVIRNTTVINRTSYNGPGGVNARPRPEDQAAMREQHVQPTSQQTSHEHSSAGNRANFASVNGGRPSVAAVPRPMTSSNMQAPNGGNHTATNNNSRPAYNQNQANNGFHSAANNNAQRPQANVGYQQPANNNAQRPQASNNTPRPQGNAGYQQPANNNYHPQANNNAPRPQGNNAYHPPAGNDAHYTAAPHSPEPMHQGAVGQQHVEAPHQGGGGQPHNEPHQGGGGGGDHDHR